jgi:acyl-coenzyme A synthetase/AMP-(fatty) acid ligase
MHAAMARDRVSGAKSVVWAFNDHGKDEVLIAVSLAEGRTLDPVDLISFLKPRMAHFMVPRCVRILVDLPKTPTNKIENTLFARMELRPTPLIATQWALPSRAKAVRQA